MLGKGLGIALALLVVVISLFGFHGAGIVSPRSVEERSKIPISRETTFLTEPVDELGYLMVTQAIDAELSQGVTRENNAAVLLIEALGGVAEGRELTVECERLGIELPIEGAVYQRLLLRPQAGVGLRPQAGVGVAVSVAEFERVSAGPWSRDEFPETAAWIDVNAEPLAKVAEAVQRPRYYVPILDQGNGVWSVLLSDVQACRDIARCLQVRAYLAMEEGRFDDAWQDQMTLHRLAIVLSQTPFLIGNLVAIAIDSMACNIDRAWLEALPEMSEFPRDAQRQFDELSPLKSLADSMRYERMMIVELANRLERGTPPEGLDGFGPDGVFTMATRMRVDWGRVLIRCNEYYDLLDKVMRIENAAERRAKLQEVQTDRETRASQLTTALKNPLNVAARIALGSRDQNSDDFAVMIAMTFQPQAIHLVNADDRIANDRDLVRIAFAVADHRIRTGALPTELEELELEAKRINAIDRFTGKPFIMRTDDEGTLLVYHCGVNAIDDGGPSKGNEGNGGQGSRDDQGFVWKKR